MILGIDTEFLGLDHYHGMSKPFFTTICIDEQKPVYWEWDVDYVTRQPDIPAGDLEEIADILNEADEILGQNIKAEISVLASVGLKWRREWFHKTNDTLYAAHILASGEPHDLTVLALKHLRIDIKPYEDDLILALQEARRIAQRDYKNWRIAKKTDPLLPSAKDGKELHKWDMALPRAIAKAKGWSVDHPWQTVLSKYSVIDSSVLKPIWTKQQKLLQDRNLWKIYLERRKLIRIIWEMESSGVTFSDQRLNEMLSKFQARSKELGDICIANSDGKLTEMGKGTSNAMRELCFDHWKLPILKTSKDTGNPSMDKGVLEQWEFMADAGSKQHKFISALRQKRKKDASIGYMESYKRYGIPCQYKSPFVQKAANKLGMHVLHSSYNATGQVTLRWSSSNPNAENISKQIDDDGLNVRYCFGPAPGREWWSLDYENLELRLPAYRYNEPAMIQLFEAPNEPPYFGSYHLLVFDILHPELFAEHGDKVKKIYKDTWYQYTKNGNFAVGYGAMEESGTADRAYHVEGAQAIIQSRFTNLKAANEQAVRNAYRRGYVETFPDKECGSYPIMAGRSERGYIRPTTPFNYEIQSTACWCMARAMVRVDDYLKELNEKTGPNSHFISIQIHDEIVLDFPKGKRPDSNLPKILHVQKLMEKSGDDVGVPLRVSYSHHPDNWQEEVKVEYAQAG